MFDSKQDKMDELKSKIDYYNDLVRRALESNDTTLIPEIRSMNRTISQLLNEQVEKLTYLRQDSPTISQERDRLIERLRQIQKDYNGLLDNTDDLETLRRIRQEESAEGRRLFGIYLMAFLGLCTLLLAYLAFFAQKRATTAIMAPTPPSMPTFV